jgi:hypothetical protein
LQGWLREVGLGSFFLTPCLVLCSQPRSMCLRVDSQGRCVRQATICRESGAVDHQQVEAGAHVESFSMPYRDSFRTAAKRGYAPMRFDPWTRRCSASKGRGRRRMFQQPWRHLKDANIEFTARMWAKRAASPPIAASCASGIRPLASISRLDLAVYLVISRGGRRHRITRIHDGRENVHESGRREKE